MSLQQVKIACLQYDHTMPLFEGAVKIEGVDAAFETATTLKIPEKGEQKAQSCDIA